MEWAEGTRRCRWANPKNPDYIAYHDNEWGVPLHDDRALFELLILETFQAGLSWECVLNKRPAFREAFEGFYPEHVAAFGEEEGWDVPLGLKTEIVPLTRPFANYSGNVFQGRVLLDGKPVPGAVVEVEYYNRDAAYAVPNAYFTTQVIKADEEGVFTYSVPWAGWWGFAALNTAKEKMDHQGSPKDVELGAVIWMDFTAPLKK